MRRRSDTRDRAEASVPDSRSPNRGTGSGEVLGPMFAGWAPRSIVLMFGCLVMDKGRDWAVSGTDQAGESWCGGNGGFGWIEVCEEIEGSLLRGHRGFMNREARERRRELGSWVGEES